MLNWCVLCFVYLCIRINLVDNSKTHLFYGMLFVPKLSRRPLFKYRNTTRPQRCAIRNSSQHDMECYSCQNYRDVICLNTATSYFMLASPNPLWHIIGAASAVHVTVKSYRISILPHCSSCCAEFLILPHIHLTIFSNIILKLASVNIDIDARLLWSPTKEMKIIVSLTR